MESLANPQDEKKTEGENRAGDVCNFETDERLVSWLSSG